jgi:alkylhydroperoxidase/carboxymuconolactone decarboxylase family protein YurZ
MNQDKKKLSKVSLKNVEEHQAKGDWNPLWDNLLKIDPEFIEAYLNFRAVPHKKGPIPPKYKELILIAINASTTHLYGPGVRRHIQNAFKLGATPDEILECIQLTTILGIHSCNLAIPIFMEELEISRSSHNKKTKGKK